MNENNDIFARPGGRLAINRDLQAITQQSEHAIRTLVNEMVLAWNRGINTEISVFDGSPNFLSFEASVRTALNRIPEVLQVVDFQANLANNNLRYTATIRTVFGENTVSGNGGL